MSRRYRDTWYYPPSKPKEVKGGIKAQSKRGAFANQWWGKRWIETIESFRIGARLSRGRSYARKGQVASLNIDSGLVTANVQGSRSGQYRVRIAFKVLTDKQWQKMLGQLIEEPIFAARLLSNEMPEEIEGVFEKAGLHLFPQRKGDLKTECSCPDWSNPCKHIAAVFYLMAEAFDNDPFLLFKLRGMGREAFLEKLRGTGATEEATGQVAGPQTEPVPLPTDMRDFWQVSPDSTNTVMPAAKVSLHAAIPKRLGNLPFWRSDDSFLETMDSVYQRTADLAVHLLSAGAGDNGTD